MASANGKEHEVLGPTRDRNSAAVMAQVGHERSWAILSVSAEDIPSHPGLREPMWDDRDGRSFARIG